MGGFICASAGCLHGESEMRGAEVRGESDDPEDPAASPDMVVIGHAGISIVHAGNLSWTSAGGSGYAVAASAASLIGARVGLVAAVGKDLDLAPLRRRHVDLAGVTVLPGPSAKLRVREFDDGTRSFSAELGVAATARPETFPPRYLDASHIHLGTAPPDQQLTWLEYLHDRDCRAQISADMFEHYVATYPTACTGTPSFPCPRRRSSSSADPPARASSWTVIRRRWRPARSRWWIRQAAARSWLACSSRCGPTGSPSAGP